MSEKILRPGTLGFPARVTLSIQARSSVSLVMYELSARTTQNEQAPPTACGRVRSSNETRTKRRTDVAAGGNRKWVSREDIAEIYDSLACKVEKTEPKLGESIYRTADKNLARANQLRARAATLRATERLSRPLGDRVA